jgi:RHS repeat-associated protein
MVMPGRKYTAGSLYRYGFNGKENDNDIKGDGNQQDYGMRIYDTRLGRFLSVDPLTTEYPELTPYQFASNRPIEGIDLDGLEFYDAKSAKISTLVSYDPKSKQITEVTAYLIYSNIANGLKQKIHKHYRLPGNYYDKNMNPAIRVANLNLIGNDVETLNNSPELQEKTLQRLEKKNTVAEMRYEKMQKSSRISRIANSNAGRSTENVVNTNGVKTASRIEGIVKGTGKVIEIVYDFWEKNWEVSSIHSQATMSINNVGRYLNQAISNNMIPSNFLNDIDLSSLGNYILYGEIPTTTSPSGATITNEELLNTGKSIWKFIQQKRKEENRNLPDIQIPVRDNTYYIKTNQRD